MPIIEEPHTSAGRAFAGWAVWWMPELGAAAICVTAGLTVWPPFGAAFGGPPLLWVASGTARSALAERHYRRHVRKLAAARQAATEEDGPRRATLHRLDQPVQALGGGEHE